MADPDRIRAVARRCLRARAAGHDLVVVVSAMSGETNRLLKLVQAVNERPSEREQDVVVATGEQVTIALLAMARATQQAAVKPKRSSKARISDSGTAEPPHGMTRSATWTATRARWRR